MVTPQGGSEWGAALLHTLGCRVWNTPMNRPGFGRELSLWL